jgi:hypothetical protein
MKCNQTKMEFKCSVCNYTSEYKKNVQRHFHTKCGEKNAEIVEIPIDIKCEDCDKIFTTKYSLRRHANVCKSKKNKIKQITLFDKKGNVKAYTLIDEEDFEKMNQFKWNLDKDGYVRSLAKGLFHRLIMNASKDDIIDHKNNIKTDNRKENLRFVTRSQNAQNINKRDGNFDSRYKGVCFHKGANKWRCSISVNNVQKSLLFDKEEHAAYWYDQLALKYFGEDANINGIEIPDDFEEPLEKEKKTLPKGLTLTKQGKYRVRLSKIDLGTYETIEEAESVYRKKKDRKTQNENTDFIKDDDGNPILEIRDEIVFIDEDKYQDIMRYSWYINKNGYVVSHNPYMLLHRYVMSAEKDSVIDHINGNKKDNREINLRTSTPALNSHNKIKSGNTSSRYIGVSKKDTKFQAAITKDGKRYYLGYFNHQKEAAEAYNKKALELYGGYARLNIIEV